jgi:protein tyrosine phosphatase
MPSSLEKVTVCFHTNEEENGTGGRSNSSSHFGGRSIYISDWDSAVDEKLLKENNIGCILNMCSGEHDEDETKIYQDLGIKTYQFGMNEEDYPIEERDSNEQILEYWNQAYKTIEAFFDHDNNRDNDCTATLLEKSDDENKNENVVGGRSTEEESKNVVGGCSNILIHCVAGVNRSASTIIFYLMKKFGMKYLDAFNTLKVTRPQINLDKTFIDLLLAFKK